MIQLQKVTKSFLLENGEEKKVLNGIDLQVESGDFMCLLGPSGCGKSTLLRLISGLDCVTSGKIIVDGQSINEATCESAFVFQNYALFPWMTVLENVELGMKLRKMYTKSERREKALQLLRYVNLSGYEESYINKLSGGMKQRVAIARALVMRPKILYMDEPFGALDTFTRMGLQDLLLDICKTRDMTVMFVTHDIDEAIYLGNKVAIMNSNTGLIQNIVDIDKNLTKDRSGNVFNEYRNHLYREFDLCKSATIEIEYYL